MLTTLTFFWGLFSDVVRKKRIIKIYQFLTILNFARFVVLFYLEIEYFFSDIHSDCPGYNLLNTDYYLNIILALLIVGKFFLF